MSDGADSAARTGLDIREKEKKEIEEFYQHLIKHSQATTYTGFAAGSWVEIPGLELVFNRNELNAVKLLDQDQMSYSNEIYAFSYLWTVPEQFYGKVVRIYSASSHVGYTKLCYENSNIDLQHISTELLGTRHGPADKHCFESSCDHFVKVYTQVSSNSLRNSNNKMNITDDVHAVHSLCWPMEANEWISRIRLNSVPSNSTIRKIIRYGCDFVQVSHKLSTEKNEWRFSFSKAELIIIRSWKAIQRIVYRTLHMLSKIIKIRLESSVLCTYYFKTLMLWAAEEKPAEFWSEDVLVYSVCELLSEMAQWLKIGFCPNYFIPRNNMIDYVTGNDLSADIDALYQVSRTTNLVVNILHANREVEIEVVNSIYRIEAPVWLYTSLVIYEQIVYREKSDTQRFARSFSTLLHKALNFEMCKVYYRQKQLKKSTGKLIHLVEENFLLCADTSMQFQGCHISCVTARSSATIYFLMLSKWSLKCEPTSSLISAHEITKNCLNALTFGNIEIDLKCFLYSRSMYDVDKTKRNDHFNENICSKYDIRIVACETRTVGYKVHNNVKFYEEFPGMSPTVNIGWFLNKAYLANLYYTTQHDYSATVEMCDDIIRVYKQSYFNQRFAECSLPVILSTDWTPVYGKELQNMLGLYSLCSFMFNKTDRSHSVCLGVCPVLFALYLKCCCAADQVNITTLREVGLERCSNCIDAVKGHLKECDADDRVCNGKPAILAALEVTDVLICN